MAGCGYMTASVYLISFFFIIGISIISKASLTDYQTAGLHPVICRNLSFRNGSCHPSFLCGCRSFSRGIMVCYRMGRVTSITTMNYSVAIFVYSRMMRYPDNAITELQYSRISLF